MAENHYKVVIIGSGPAGWTAAIYAARANLSPLVLQGTQPGGQLTITTDVENFPGFPEGIMGPELMEKFQAQAERFGTKVVYDTVTEVDFSKRPFTVMADEGTYTADTVIVATGASAKWIGLESEKKLMGHGVSSCATCDGAFFRGKEVIVVGGGDTAMEEANFLTRFCAKVVVVHRRDSLRASKIMQDRAFANPKIEFIWDTAIEEIVGSKETGVTGVKLKNLKSGEVTDFATQGVFVAIGHQPNTGIFEGKLELHPNGYLKVQPGTASTSVEGVFGCGDVTDHHYRQAITAAGTGCMAAMDAEKYLEALEASATPV
ncbi:thioredoxin-disulfide reductase [Vampirovibrio chlorellavorus]|uniref:thioredoxin-disulfide reductase n=1 Tax=Vampirovibrio chlorellavorus TaxID=758823 RepID=UPI0026F187C7|nr:thioredoxin-disulfide reductase [Vampirovibrio chlorellavorus]